MMMVKGCGVAVGVLDCASPLGYGGVIWVDGLQVVDVPQQVSPAALYGAVVMVVGGVEIADQHAGGALQHLL